MPISGQCERDKVSTLCSDLLMHVISFTLSATRFLFELLLVQASFAVEVGDFAKILLNNKW